MNIAAFVKDTVMLGIDKSKARRIMAMLFFSFVIPSLGGLVLNVFELKLVSIPVHALMETAGAVMAFILATLIFSMYRKEHVFSHFHRSSVALIGMGILDFFHAMMMPGELFVWLHSLAVLFGGLLFMSVWLPERRVSVRWYYFVPVAVVIFSISVSLGSILMPGWAPTMLVAGEFSNLSIMINMIGGFAFFVAGINFLMRYWQDGRFDDLLFTGHTFLFGVSGLLFALSALWDLSWWLWHLLRLVAYFIALFYAYVIFMRENNALEQATTMLKDTQDMVRVGNWERYYRDGTTWLSEEVFKILGRPFQPMVSYELVLEYIQPDDRERVIRTFDNSLQPGQHCEIEYRVIRPDGEIRHVHSIGRVTEWSEGRPVKVAGAIQDITERKMIEEEMAQAIRALDREVAEHRRTGAALKKSDERFRQILESAADAILVSDAEGRILTVNHQVERLFGFSRHELIDQPVEMLLPESLREKHTTHRRVYHADPKQRSVANRQELSGRRKDGTLVPLEISLSPSGESEERMATAIIRDLSVRKAAEAELRRLNRTHIVLSRCNNSLARSGDEVGLLKAFCANLVEVGGYGFAWVGYAKQNRTKDIRVMAHAGRVDAVLSVTKITWSDAGEKSSPCGTAIRTGRPVILRDIEREPKFAQWRKSALRLGYRSMIALPLKTNSHTFGNFTIYATVANVFNDKEVELLLELAEDLAFGIETIRVRAAHERKVRRLREEVERDTRKRVAAVLHDGVAQSVQGVNLGLMRLRTLAAGGKQLPADLLDRITDDTRGILGELREISHELRPLFLERMGLIEAIQYYCGELSEGAGITIRVVAQEVSVQLEERVKEQCFLSFREALSNAVKHANASRIDVILEVLASESLSLRIADDGIGFDTARMFNTPSGLGLSMIDERAESIGGSAQILSTPGQGTTVTITAPLGPDLGATHDTPRPGKGSVEE